MTDESLHVTVVDIGRLANLGWAIKGPSVKGSGTGTDIDECVEVLARAMKNGPLALGFEGPMFVPYGKKRCDLDKCRKGEGDRAFGAAAGACVLAKGLVIVPYILEELRCRVKAARPTFNWRSPLLKQNLLLFEAFVTNMGKSVSHEDCAQLAINQFLKRWENRASFKSDVEERCTMNLLGAMLLRMGWTDDLTMLSEPCLVVRHKGKSN
jgi:hypothetical protein